MITTLLTWSLIFTANASDIAPPLPNITEQIGTQLDLNTKLIDENGHEVALSNYFHKSRPVILSLVYYSCPSLCNLHLNGLVKALKDVKLSMGKDYDLLAVSFDSSEQYSVSAGKKISYLEAYGRKDSTDGMHFLTGSEDSVKTLTQEVGFKFQWVESSKEWAHASAAIFISPEGQVLRYLHGADFDQKNLTLAIVESGQWKTGSLSDNFIFTFVKYDSQTGEYVIAKEKLFIFGFVVVSLLIFVVFLFLKRRR